MHTPNRKRKKNTTNMEGMTIEEIEYIEVPISIKLWGKIVTSQDEQKQRSRAKRDCNKDTVSLRQFHDR